MPKLHSPSLSYPSEIGTVFVVLIPSVSFSSSCTWMTHWHIVFLLEHICTHTRVLKLYTVLCDRGLYKNWDGGVCEKAWATKWGWTHLLSHQFVCIVSWDYEGWRCLWALERWSFSYAMKLNKEPSRCLCIRAGGPWALEGCANEGGHFKPSVVTWPIFQCTDTSQHPSSAGQSFTS